MSGVYLQSDLNFVSVPFTLLVTPKLWAAVEQGGGHPRLVGVDRGWGNQAGRGGGVASLRGHGHDEGLRVALGSRPVKNPGGRKEERKEERCWEEARPAAPQPRAAELKRAPVLGWSRGTCVPERFSSEPTSAEFHWLKTGAWLDDNSDWIKYPDAFWETKSTLV